MRQPFLTRYTLAPIGAALVVGLAACASSPGDSGSMRSSSILNPADMGQMGSLQTPRGETGTPHTHGAAATAPRAAGAQGAGSSILSPSDMGQMGSQGTSQGETGTPHRH
jgi:hypothetical protein